MFCENALREQSTLKYLWMILTIKNESVRNINE